jgi:uncharacterized protein YjeT (DUF2065 family)
LLSLSEQNSKKLSQSLTDQNNMMLWIAGGCAIGGVIIGILIRGVFK